MGDSHDLNKIRDSLELLKREELVRVASRHVLSVDVFVGKWLIDGEGRKEHRGVIRAALKRQLTHAGPTPRGGYDDRLIEMLGVYQEATGLPLAETLTYLGLLEIHAFNYRSHQESARCLAAVKHVLDVFEQQFNQVSKGGTDAERSLKDLLREKGFNPDIPLTGSTWRKRYAEGAIHKMASVFGWNCQGGKRLPSTPLTTSEVFQSVMALFARDCLNVHFIGLGHVASNFETLMGLRHFERAVQQFHEVSKAGMTQRQMREIREQHGINVLAFFCGLILDLALRPEDFEEVRRSGLLEGNGAEARRVLEVWQTLDRPCTLKQFVDVGGTHYDWQHYVEEDRRQREENLRRGLDAQERKRLAQLPKNKRKQEQELPTIDFRALEERLVVVEPFMECCEPSQVRTLIVRGFLQHGDRLPAAAELQPREIRKLWKSCRSAFTRKRELERLVRYLELQGVLKREGKLYRLGTPSARQPDAQAQITKIKTLISSAHARS